MKIFRTAHLDGLQAFAMRTEQLAVVEREPPKKSESFFQKVILHPLRVTGKVYKASALEDIREILKDHIPKKMQRTLFYEDWLIDMAEVSTIFCEILDTHTIVFWLGSQRGCRRYHVDNVPLRALVTYAGKGTEWLPDEAADRTAFINKEPNKNILKDKSLRQFMDQWDIAVFRGGPKGLLHRTPDDALDYPSILMRLDSSEFWRKVLENEKKDGHINNNFVFNHRDIL